MQIITSEDLVRWRSSCESVLMTYIHPLNKKLLNFNNKININPATGHHRHKISNMYLQH